MGEEHPLLPIPTKLTIELRRNNIFGFQDLLPSYHVETSMWIFELTCHTADRAEFIRECIEIGYNVNKLNMTHQKRPIDYASESCCMHNLKALLMEPTVNIDKKCPAWSGKTPINFLVSRIDDHNFERIFSCIQILVENFANVNISDDGGTTPILRLLHNEHLDDSNKKAVLIYLFQNAIEVDIDNYGNGNIRQLLEKEFSDLELPPISDETSNIWHFDRLRQCLIEMNEVEFLKGLNNIVEWNEIDLQQLFEMQDGKFTLLTLAVQNNLVKAVERMLRLGADINFKPSGQFTLTPIEYACRNGFWKMLEIFLRSPKTNTNTNDPLISMTIQNIALCDEPSPDQDYEKCFQLLIQAPKIDIDQLDLHERSALYYAIKCNKQEVILALLNKGAYIGFENILELLSNIYPKSLEQYLDSWITVANRIKGQWHLNDGNFETMFDFSNLVSPAFKRSKGKCINCDRCVEEMQPIDYISKTKELRHLLKHPLIQSFLFLKWQRLALFFYMNIIAYFVFTTSILTYILSCYIDENVDTFRSNLLWWLSFAMTSVIVLREIFQLVLSPVTHLKGLENYLEIALLFMVAFVLYDFDITSEQRRTIAAVTILLVTSELFILLGSLGIFSIHFIMLKTVLISFIRGLALYVIILVAFALSFFALLNEPNYESGITQNETNINEREGFNKFNSIGLSLMKVFVMLTGEFEAGDINFRLNPFSYWLFLVFLFLISTVLFNLLNGLAVSDIQQIRDEAELTNLMQRVNMLSKFETILFGRHVSWHSTFQIPSGLSIFKFLLDTDYKVQVLSETQNYGIKNLQYFHNALKLCCVFGGCNLRMPNDIMELAEQVLHKKKIEQSEGNEKQQLVDRLSSLERKLDSVLLALKPPVEPHI